MFIHTDFFWLHHPESQTDHDAYQVHPVRKAFAANAPPLAARAGI